MRACTPRTIAAVSSEPPVRVGLRVSDVSAAMTLYESFGFVSVGTVPGADGSPIMAILRRGPLQLLVDALNGMPFPDSPRERQTKVGPRGLGVVIGLEVDEVDETARRCEAAGCVITSAPVDAPWGERYAELEDPYGYAWKLFQLTGSSNDGRKPTMTRGSARVVHELSNARVTSADNPLFGKRSNPARRLRQHVSSTGGERAGSRGGRARQSFGRLDNA
jgi:uncharacterized glyoxalase superfamily protein PhnB